MSEVVSAFGAPVWSDLGLSLLHLLWQGALLAVLARGVLWILPSSSARERYAVYTLALCLMPVLPVLTYLWLASIAAPVAAGDALAQSTPAAAPTVDGFAIVGWLWLAGALVQELRLLRSYLGAARLKRLDAEPLGESWQAVMQELAESLGLRRAVRVLRSAHARVPCLVGWLEPVVLVPAAAFTVLTPEQLRLVLAHELAHLRRFDPWINALQSAIESLLFFHPAVWWLSARVREEREYCCDDLAIEVCGDPVSFARALASLERLRGQESAPVLSSGGGSLMQRIQRMLRRDSQLTGRKSSRLAPILFTSLFLGLAGGPVYGWISSSAGHDPVHGHRQHQHGHGHGHAHGHAGAHSDAHSNVKLEGVLQRLGSQQVHEGDLQLDVSRRLHQENRVRHESIQQLEARLDQLQTEADRLQAQIADLRQRRDYLSQAGQDAAADVRTEALHALRSVQAGQQPRTQELHEHLMRALHEHYTQGQAEQVDVLLQHLHAQNSQAREDAKKDAERTAQEALQNRLFENRLFERQLRVDPGSVLRINRAQLLLEQGDLEAARLELDPSLLKARQFLHQAQIEGAQRSLQALDLEAADQLLHEGDVDATLRALELAEPALRLLREQAAEAHRQDSHGAHEDRAQPDAEGAVLDLLHNTLLRDRMTENIEAAQQLHDELDFESLEAGTYRIQADLNELLQRIHEQPDEAADPVRQPKSSLLR